MLKTYARIISVLATVLAVVLVIGSLIAAIATEIYSILLGGIVMSVGAFLGLKSQAVLMDTVADNAEHLDRLDKALSSRKDLPQQAPVARPVTAAQPVPASTSKATVEGAPAEQAEPSQPAAQAYRRRMPDGRIKCTKCGFTQSDGGERCVQCDTEFVY